MVSFAVFTTFVPMSLLARFSSGWCEYHRGWPVGDAAGGGVDAGGEVCVCASA
jgi:hypothetical protein